jgi:hypothetical protein
VDVEVFGGLQKMG